MAFKEITFLKYASDLVIDHDHYHFSNENINVTPAVLPLGTIVTRPKGSTVATAYKKVAAAADVTADNEYAVVFGNHHSFAYDFTPKAIVAGKWNALGIVRNAAFKEFYIKQNYATLLGADAYALLKQRLSYQDLLILDDVSDLKAA